MPALRRRSELAAARKSAGHTQESLAGALYVDRSTVIRWESGETSPWPYLRPKLARTLGVSTRELQRLIEPSPAVAAMPTLEHLNAAFAWLDEHTGWPVGTARRKVAKRVDRVDTRGLRERSVRRSRVSRSEIVHALAGYYGSASDGFSLYSRECDGHTVGTTIGVRPQWIDLGCSLAPATDQFTVTRSEPGATEIDADASRAAIDRLAESATLGVRLTDEPLYTLRNVDIQRGSISGMMSSTSFIRYALTADILENELLDALSTSTRLMSGSTALRDRHLPSLTSIADIASRECVGGVLALVAIARPAGPGRSCGDYMLLVQERSEEVVNAPRRLAVIPKGFHRPFGNYGDDARLEGTLQRELEEELFARHDLGESGANRVADPMHPARLSEPMRWLNERDAVRLECTGFGLNMVSGNYEFACLAVIDDDSFWSDYGGVVEANWEASGLRQYSSLDRAGLADLIRDEAWSNEGVFALLEGIRRLAETSPERVDAPTVL